MNYEKYTNVVNDAFVRRDVYVMERFKFNTGSSHHYHRSY